MSEVIIFQLATTTASTRFYGIVVKTSAKIFLFQTRIKFQNFNALFLFSLSLFAVWIILSPENFNATIYFLL
jgi:hypothetical protein